MDAAIDEWRRSRVQQGIDLRDGVASCCGAKEKEYNTVFDGSRLVAVMPSKLPNWSVPVAEMI